MRHRQVYPREQEEEERTDGGHRYACPEHWLVTVQNRSDLDGEDHDEKGQGHGNAPDGRLVRTLLDGRQVVDNQQSRGLTTERNAAVRKWAGPKPATPGMVTSGSLSDSQRNSADPRSTYWQRSATSYL